MTVIPLTGDIPRAAGPDDPVIYALHNALSRTEIDRLFLTYLQIMAEENCKNHNLARLMGERVGSDGKIPEASLVHFCERIQDTLDEGPVEMSVPPIEQHGKLLTVKNYHPFTRASNASQAPFIRSPEPFTGRMEINDMSATSPMIYCTLLGIENNEDVTWPIWNRNVFVPRRDIRETDDQR